MWSIISFEIAGMFYAISWRPLKSSPSTIPSESKACESLVLVRHFKLLDISHTVYELCFQLSESQSFGTYSTESCPGITEFARTVRSRTKLFLHERKLSIW